MTDTSGYMKFRTEAQLQAHCAQWFWNTLIDERRMLFHVDNNSENENKGSIKKALGVCRGPSDFVFIVELEVIFIEMKLPGEDQTKEQKDFQAKVEARGHRYIIIEYFETFKAFIMFELLKER